MRGGLQERHCGRQAAGASEALEAGATVRETSPACLRSQPCAQEPQSPERETAKPGRGSDDGPNTVGDDARYCGGRPRFPERAPPLTTSFPGRVRRRPRMCCAPPPLPPTRDFFFFFLPLLAMLAGGVPRSSMPRGRSLFPGSLRPARAPESRPCSPLRRSRARALASVRLPGPQLRERGQRGVSGASAAILGSESLGARTVAGLARRGEALPAEPEGSAHEKGICASRGWGSIQGWARPSRETLG